ncbi:MAG: MFS transporter [Solirubrobacterales bacterium]
MRRIAIAAAAALALADASIVTLGLPSILSELDTDVEGVALVLGVYTAVLALALLPAAALSRRIGGARVAAGGTALFAAASLACGLCDSLEALLALRAVQAVGGAGTLIGAFALLDGGVAGPGRRLWFAASIFGAAIGPALGGVLTEAFDWRAIFLAQVPLVLPGMLVALRAALAGEDTAAAAETERADDSPLRPRPAVALALLSAALTAVIFLVVLLLVSGWSVDPLVAALAVSVLPVAAIAAARIPGEPETRAIAGCLLVAGGVACLALLPGDSPWWTVVPQLLAGVGMGMALPALAGVLLPERSRRDVARVLSIRHAGIAVALVLIAPIVADSLDSTISEARLQGTAALLDAGLDPSDKIEIAPGLFAGLSTDDPRSQLEDSVAAVRGDFEGDDQRELDRLGAQLDDVVTGAVRAAFRWAFVAAAAMALGAAMVLLWGASAPAGGFGRGAVAVCTALAATGAFAYAVAFADSERESVAIQDPCNAEREDPDSGGLGGFLQDRSLEALDRAACEFGSSREELLLALVDEDEREDFVRAYGEDPGSIINLGGAVLGL